MTGAPYSHDERDLDLPSDGIQEITPAAAPALNSEQIMSSEYGWIDPVVGSVSGVSRSRGPKLGVLERW